MKDSKVWFITGASTGFGKELARLVVEKGDIAIATFRKDNQVAAFNADGHPNRLGVNVDVTYPGQIHASVDAAIQHYGRIDVLVNNAGYGSLGTLEEVSEEEIRRQFEVNVFGAINMIKAVLPHMRKQRSGHILNISSIAGLVGFPGVSIYNASKFALEGMGESLAQEVAHLGIKVINIEPGPFRTDWAGRSASYATTQIEDYKDTAGERLKMIQGISGKQPGDPIKAVEAMYKIVQVDNPPIHLILGGRAYVDIEKKLERFQKEIADFEHLGKPTDYPDGV